MVNGIETSEQPVATVRMQELLSCASDAAFAVDTELRIVAWNGNAERLLGYDAAEVAGRQCCDVIQAVLPGGEPLCGPACPAGLCFARRWPFAIGACRVRHRCGYWIPLCIGSIVNPRDAQQAGGSGLGAILLLRNSEKVPVGLFTDHIPRIFTFGRFGIVLDNKALAVNEWTRKQALTLLKYLVTNSGNEVHRERLMECLWPGAEEDQARKRLKVVVHFLRRQFKEAGVVDEAIMTTVKGYALRRGAAWVDAEQFQHFAREGASLQRRQQWEEALRRYQEACLLYRGDYLEEDVYADWCAEERANLRETFLDVLAQVARICTEQNRFVEAIEVCREALVREPCRESFHRTLMACLARIGRHDEALAQYQRCLRTLARELGAEPMPETQRLYQNIRAHAAPHSDPHS